MKSRSKNSRSRKSRSRKTYSLKPCVILEEDLQFINKIVWDVTSHPLEARLNGEKLSPKLLFKSICEGDMTLLLPINHPETNDAIVVLHKIHIRGHRIRVIQILRKIFDFYNNVVVEEQDLEELKAVESKKGEAVRMQAEIRNKMKLYRFADLLGRGNTSFGGLAHQKGRTFIVKIKKFV